MSSIKKIFAIIFTVMAVMLIQTAVYADVPVFTQQPTDVVLSSTTEGSVYYKLNRSDVRVELWEVGGTSCINALGSSTACPVSEAIGKTCFLRAYVTGSSQYAQSNNFKVSINRAFIQQPQDLTVTQPTGNKVYYQLNFTPSFVVLYCIVGEDIVGIPNAADATSCNVDGVLGQTCFLRANYNTSSGSYYIQSDTFKVTANFAFTQQPQDVYVTKPGGNVVTYALNFEPVRVELWTSSNTRITDEGAATSCPIDKAIGKTCYLRAYYNNLSTGYIASKQFEITAGPMFLEQPYQCDLDSSPLNDAEVCIFKLSFAPAKKSELREYGTNTLISNATGAEYCELNGTVNGKQYYIRAYYNTENNGYIDSDPFTVNHRFIEQPVQCDLDSSPVDDGMVCTFKLSFIPAKKSELREYGTDILITDNSGSAYCYLNGTLNEKQYYIRAYYNIEDNGYVNSEPFTVNYKFSTQPYYEGGKMLLYKLNYIPPKNTQLWEYRTENCISTNGGYEGCVITGAEGKTCFIRAFYTDKDYIDSEPVKIGSCSVIFDADGGVVNIDNYAVPSGTEITLPKCTFTPPDDITEFSHWEIDGKTYYEGSKVVIKVDTVVKSVWKPEYTVSFDPAAGTGEIPSFIAVEGKDIVLPKCTFTPPENYIFTYWSIGGKLFNEGDEYTVSADTVVKAVWGRKRIAQFLDSSNQEINYVYVGEGEELTMPDYKGNVPTGKQFAYWVHNKDVGTPIYAGDKITVNDDMTFLSMFETKVCKVVFDTNGMGAAPETQDVTYNQYASRPSVQPVNGYAVSGWYMDKNCENIFSFETRITDDMTLYAKWEEIASVITVDGNEKTAVIYYGDDLKFEFSDSLAPTDDKYKLWLEYIPSGETQIKTKLIKGDVPVIYSSEDENYSVILNPNNVSTTAKIGAGIYATYSGAVKIDLIVIYKQGDFNKNGKLDEEDAKMLLKHISGGAQLDEEQYARADVNGDGYKNMLDVITILNK